MNVKVFTALSVWRSMDFLWWLNPSGGRFARDSEENVYVRPTGALYLSAPPAK